jgi:poly(A) polymerase
MVLLSEVGQVDKEIAEFWTRVQGQSAEQRAQSFQIGGQTKNRRRRRRRRKKDAAPANPS